MYLNKASQEEADRMESKFAMVMGTINHNYTDIPNDTPVMIYEDRRKNISDDLRQIALAIKMFSPYAVGLEMNEEMIIDYLEKQGINVEGYKVKENEVLKMTRLFEELIDSDEIKQIEMIDIIKALKVWRIKNTDVGSAYGLYLLMKDRHKERFARRKHTDTEEKPLILLSGIKTISEASYSFFKKFIM